jgi:hypothetical protein
VKADQAKTSCQNQAYQTSPIAESC